MLCKNASKWRITEEEDLPENSRDVLHLERFEKYSYSALQEEYLIRLISQTFGQFVTQYNRRFTYCRRSLNRQEEILQYLRAGYERQRGLCADCRNYIEDCIASEGYADEAIFLEATSERVQKDILELARQLENMEPETRAAFFTFKKY